MWSLTAIAIFLIVADFLINGQYPSLLLIAIAIFPIVATIVTKRTYSDLAIEDDVLIFKSDVKEKRFAIEKIEEVDIIITMNSSFSVDIEVPIFDQVVGSKKNIEIASFYSISFSRENLAVLKQLILLCKKSNVTAKELDTLVKKSCWSLL